MYLITLHRWCGRRFQKEVLSRHNTIYLFTTCISQCNCATGPVNDENEVSSEVAKELRVLYHVYVVEPVDKPHCAFGSSTVRRMRQ